MIKVTKRDFSHYPNRILKVGEYLITNHSKPEYIVTVSKVTNEAKKRVKGNITEEV